jgi:hypothetical protein
MKILVLTWPWENLVADASVLRRDRAINRGALEPNPVSVDMPTQPNGDLPEISAALARCVAH